MHVTTTPPKPSDLPVRAASAVVMIAVAGTALWLGGWVWTAFVAAVAMGVLWEWWGLVVRMCNDPVPRVLWAVAGILYVGTAALLLALLGNSEVMGAVGGSAALTLVLPLVLVVIATDIGAYFSGRAIGGPKIAASISPSKTWAGLAGGMLLAALVMAAFASSDIINAPVLTAAMIGALLAIAAQTGDFFESWMKRRAGVKDSGKLLPGHGGLFDRVDGLLAVANIVAVISVIALTGSSDL